MDSWIDPDNRGGDVARFGLSEADVRARAELVALLYRCLPIETREQIQTAVGNVVAALREVMSSPAVVGFFELIVRAQEVRNGEEYGFAKLLSEEYPNESVASLRLRAQAIEEAEEGSGDLKWGTALSLSFLTDFERRWFILSIAVVCIMFNGWDEVAKATAIGSVFMYLFPLSPASRVR